MRRDQNKANTVKYKLMIKIIIYLYQTKLQFKHKIFILQLHEQNTNSLNNLHIINSNFM